MKAKIKSIEGSNSGEIVLPEQFDEPVREDLIKRAVLAIQNNNRQPYGAKFGAGMRQHGKLSRRRKAYKSSYGIGISRVPRKIMSRRGRRFNWVGAVAPGMVGGRRAHPPKAEKKWEQKINKKERRKAIRSALSASVIKEMVEKRGHFVNDYPLIVESKIEDVVKTKDAIAILIKLGLEKELLRCSEKKIRAGKGKSRGRKYRKKKGPLMVVSKDCKLIKAASNISGVDIVEVNYLNAELLAPGTAPGRVTVYSDAAIKRIADEKLFTENPVKTAKKETKKTKEAKAKKAETKEAKPKKQAKAKDEKKGK
jgi:large subunit ribosomal protein L4e